MLKGIDKLLNANLLQVLAAMGHGDDLALVDANYPADSTARKTRSGKLIRLDGVDLASAARAICSVFPLDSFVDDPVRRMEVVGDPDTVPAVQLEVQAAIESQEGPITYVGIERYAFYEAAAQAYAVVCAASDNRAYGCFLLRKGVILSEPLP
jgi:L-fucose mutarotase